MTFFMAMLGLGLSIWTNGTGGAGVDPLALKDRASNLILDRASNTILTRV